MFIFISLLYYYIVMAVNAVWDKHCITAPLILRSNAVSVFSGVR